MLHACKPFGVELGPYGMTIFKLGLLICDDINNSVTMLLLG